METLQHILGYYPADCHSKQIDSLGSAGGFSGAKFWKIHSARGMLCLRRWPREHPTQERIEFIHRLLEHVTKSGCRVVPVPIRLRSSSPETYLKWDGYFWELTQWMPGQANYQQDPSIKKLQAAARSLANFHNLSADFRRVLPAMGPAPSVRDRLQQINDWIQRDLNRLEVGFEKTNAIQAKESRNRCRVIVDYAKRHMALVKSELSSTQAWDVPIQPCIRDIWEQHVLYRGDEVTGIIDFGASRLDTIATDLVRLLGSLAMDNQSMWTAGVQAYESERPLAALERSLIAPLDRSAVLLSGLNWLRWIFLENRTFTNWPSVDSRLKKIVQRIESD